MHPLQHRSNFFDFSTIAIRRQDFIFQDVPLNVIESPIPIKLESLITCKPPHRRLLLGGLLLRYFSRHLACPGGSWLDAIADIVTEDPFP